MKGEEIAGIVFHATAMRGVEHSQPNYFLGGEAQGHERTKKHGNNQKLGSSGGG